MAAVRFAVPPRCSASTMQSSYSSLSSSMTMRATTGSRRPSCQRPQSPLLRLSSSSSISSMDADRREVDERHDCLAAAGGSYYPHQQMGGAAHGFVRPPPCLAASEMATTTSWSSATALCPTNRPPPPPAMTMTRRQRQDQRAMKAPAAGNTKAIIDDC